MKAELVFGLGLIVCGIVALAYFTSPVRFLAMKGTPHALFVVVPYAGGIAIACGIGLLLLARTRRS